jgi:hypothetical protein
MEEGGVDLLIILDVNILDQHCGERGGRVDPRDRVHREIV